MFSVVFAVRFILMVNYCVCGGCTNSSHTGHRVHRFPNKEKKGAIFRAWVRFCAGEETGLRKIWWCVVFTLDLIIFLDNHPGDMMEFNMGCRSKNQVRLRAGAVPLRALSISIGSAISLWFCRRREIRWSCISQIQLDKTWTVHRKSFYFFLFFLLTTKTVNIMISIMRSNVMCIVTQEIEIQKNFTI